MMKKKTRIIAKVKSKYWQRMHKYGVQMPKMVRQVIELDNKNGNTLWWDALMKEMKNVRPPFKVYEGDVSKLVGYQKIRCHIVWDVKLGKNFRRKARLVAGGHTTDPPSYYILFCCIQGISSDCFDNYSIKWFRYFGL